MRRALLAGLGFAVLLSCSGTSVKLFNETLVEGRPGRADAPLVPLRYGAGLPLRSFDPNGPAGWCEVTALLHARLFAADGRGRLAGDLVDATETSEDGLTVRLYLRDGASFHDGSPVLAADVVATWTALDRQPGSELKALLAPVRELRAEGEREVVLRLEHPWAELFAALAEMAVLPAGLLARGPEAMAEAPVGAGPYRLVARGPGWFELAAHRGYHQGVPRCPMIDVRVIEDDRDRARAVARGVVDLACVKPESLELFGNRERFRVEAFESGAVRAIPLDVQAPGLDDVRVRRALGALIDRPALVRETLGGYGRPAYQFLAPRNEGFDPGADRPELAPEAARALLAEAGWISGPDGLRRKDGATLRVRLAAWQGEAFRRRAAELVVARWRAEGVDAEVLPVDYEAYTAIALDLHGRAEGYVGGWGGLAAPALVLARKFSVRGGQNRIGFADAEVEQRLGEAAREPRLSLRVESVRAAQRRILDLAPWIPLATADNLFVASSRVGRADVTVVDSWYEFPRFLWTVKVEDPR